MSKNLGCFQIKMEMHFRYVPIVLPLTLLPPGFAWLSCGEELFTDHAFQSCNSTPLPTEVISDVLPPSEWGVLDNKK